VAQSQRSLDRTRVARQGILSAAFSGKLVPQNPHGEPASVLLERIAAEIAATGSTYLVSWLAFGDMTLAESLNSLELFAREVMPGFAGGRGGVAE